MRPCGSAFDLAFDRVRPWVSAVAAPRRSSLTTAKWRASVRAVGWLVLSVPLNTAMFQGEETNSADAG
jgi:hypothetical protein